MKHTIHKWRVGPKDQVCQRKNFCGSPKFDFSTHNRKCDRKNNTGLKKKSAFFQKNNTSLKKKLGGEVQGVDQEDQKLEVFPLLPQKKKSRMTSL